MIRSFRHKGLRDLFLTGRSAGVRADLRKRCLVRLDALNAATELRQLDLPGFRLHPLKGDQAGRWAIDVSGPLADHLRMERGWRCAAGRSRAVPLSPGTTR